MATVTIITGTGTVTQTISTGARGPAGAPGSSASIDSYVSDIETLPDYPSSFPTTPADISNVGTSKLLGRHGSGTGTAQEIGIDGGLELQGGNLRRSAITGPVTVAAGGSVSAIADGALTIAMTSGLQTALDGKAASVHTHVSADITDASEGGNGAADAGKLVKFTSDGWLLASQLSAYIEDIGIPAVYADSVNGTSLVVAATNADLFAQFAGTGNNNAFVARVNGAFGWVRGDYSGRITAAGTLTANRTYTLPDASGTIALLSGNQTFSGQIELSGQAATSATSAMNRGLCDTRYARAWGAALTAGVNSDTNTTTYKTVTELSFELDVGTYYIDAIFLHNGNASYATSGVKDRLNFTGTATAWGTLYRVLDNATTSTSVPNAMASSSPITESAPSNRSQTTWRKGVLTVTAAGTLQVQIAQFVAVAAASTTLAAGSSISIVKLS